MGSDGYGDIRSNRDGGSGRMGSMVRKNNSFKEVLKGEGQQRKGLGDRLVRGLQKEEESSILMIKGEIIGESMTWLSNCLVGEMKDIEMLTKCMSMIQAYGLGDCDIRYLGGLNVLLEFNTKEVADCFLRNQKVNWSVWLLWLKAWDDKYWQDYKLTSVRISGVPPRFWITEVFSTSTSGIFTLSSSFSICIPIL
ncbi:hypothetical protein LXL04_021355 [Taraxacum kok-saghyz]